MPEKEGRTMTVEPCATVTREFRTAETMMAFFPMISMTPTTGLAAYAE
jgi:hypothetical protein